MSLIPFVIMLSSPEAATLADRLAAKHNKMTTAAVFVSDGLTSAIPTKIKLAPGVCTLALPNQQIVEMKSNNIKFFDQIFNQVAAVKPEKPVKVPDSSVSVAVVQREALAWLLDGKQRNTFFTEIKRDPRWTVKPNSLLLVDAKKKMRSEVLFDTSFRVVEIKLTLNNRVLTDWKYRYVSEKDVPSIPANAKVVRGLPSRPNLPAKTNGQVVLLAQKVWRSVSRLENRTIVQTNDDGTYALSIKPGVISEKGPKGSWTLNKTTLTISPKKGSEKTLQGNSGKYLDGLRSAGLEASPFAWYLLNRKLPYLDMFDQSESIELEGQGVFSGKTLSILSLKRRSNRIRMYVDPASGDLTMISSDALDSSGSVISSSRVKISYQ